MSDLIQRNNDVRYELIAEPVAEPPPEPVLRQLHRVFRGRYRLVIGLALALSLLGGLAGSHMVRPRYRSTGLVKVEGALPAILYRSPENSALPQFDAYVASQATFLQSRPVLDAAVATPELQRAGWPAGREGVARLQSALSITRGRGEQVIRVGVTDTDPQLARTAVNAVLNAFCEQYRDPQGLSSDEKERLLSERARDLETELRQLREEALRVSDHYGAEAIERMHARRIEELLAIDEKLAELQAAEHGPELPASAGAFGSAGTPASPTGAAAPSPLQRKEAELIAELETLRPKYGPDHPMMRELSRRLEAIRIQMDLQDRSFTGAVVEDDPDDPSQAALLQAWRDRIEQARTRYRIIRGETHEDLERLAHQRIALTALNERISEVRTQLQQTRRRLDELRVESQRGAPNRVRIVAHGDLPVAPVRDRRPGLAAALALFGLLCGTAGAYFLVTRERRARYVDELQQPNAGPPVIGVLPELTDDHERHQRSARSVHQLRNLLEVQCTDPNRNVLAVTSTDRGEGKTSLALALGASYANAGRKTLLIDADIDRRSLSLELLLHEAPGLCETIGPERAAAQVHDTGQPNLWALPVGISRDLDPEDLSRDRLVWLLDALRCRFDAVIVDTGPLLTGIEAALVAAVSDRVLLLVARNQRLDRIDATLARIDQIGADCAGMVFNRASERDADRVEADAVATPHRIAPFVTGAASPPSRTSLSPTGPDRLPFPRMDNDESSPFRRAA